MGFLIRWAKETEQNVKSGKVTETTQVESFILKKKNHKEVR